MMSNKGCDTIKFAELIMTSGNLVKPFVGIVLNEDVLWVCFHGTYDFAYFLRLLLNKNLHDFEDHF